MPGGTYIRKEEMHNQQPNMFSTGSSSGRNSYIQVQPNGLVNKGKRQTEIWSND